MTDATPDSLASPDTLAEIRREIDRIDEAMHLLLMERGAVIDRLIEIKRTAATGSAFRPQREADMMRRIAARHQGRLPLATAEHLWRTIISTFTHVQSPFTVHVEQGSDALAMHDVARFHIGFDVPLVGHSTPQRVIAAVRNSIGDLGLVRIAAEPGSAWWDALGDDAPQIMARLPFLARSGHPAPAPAFVVARPLGEAGVAETAVWAVDADVDAAFPENAETLASVVRNGRRLSLVAAAGGDAPAPNARRLGGYASPVAAGRPGPMTIAEDMTTDALPRPRPGALAIDPYVPGKSKAPAGVRLHKLSSNETPLGPSPRAIEAFREAAGNLEVYPDGGARVLREAIARAHGLDPERIVCGAGSDELLSLLASAYLTEGDEGLFTEHGFLVYKIAILAAGGSPVVAPETDLTADVDALLARVTDRTRIVYLANPNNPTGTYLPFDEVKRLHAGLPTSTLLVLDAAYSEYVRANDYAAGIELVSSSENVVMTRTFSKVFGLASLRIGWLYGPASVVDALNRIRGPFNVSGPAIAAGAAAVVDRAHLDAAVAHNAEWLAKLTEGVRALGLEVAPSVANFILIRFPKDAGRTAADADAYLTARGLILRAVGAYGLPDCLRLSIGSAEANEAVLSALGEFMGASRG